MRWIHEHPFGVAEFDDAAREHHGDAVADLAHEPQVVRDEKIRQAQPRAQVEQQIHDLRLDGHVERRHRLVEDDERRLEGERARQADPLALAAAELVRILRLRLAAEADKVEQIRTLSARARLSPRPWIASGSPTIVAGRHARVQ